MFIFIGNNFDQPFPVYYRRDEYYIFFNSIKNMITIK